MPGAGEPLTPPERGAPEPGAPQPRPHGPRTCGAGASASPASEPCGVLPHEGDAGAGARRVVVDPEGPVLVEGPVEVVRADGSVARSDRFVVALCTCRRTRTPPWCDTSHRGRRRPPRPGRDHRPACDGSGRAAAEGSGSDRDD